MSTSTETAPAARQSGLLPAPLSQNDPSTAQSTQTGTSGIVALEGAGSTNFIYIYSFLSTLFILLCIAILVLLRALLRRRRLDGLFNPEGESSTDINQSAQQRRRRQKKRPHIGTKPTMSNAWIGTGPVPASLSTEALLHAIQPFSIARTPDAPIVSNEKEKAVETQTPVLLEAVQEVERKPPVPRVLPFWRIPSSSSCTLDNDRSAVSSEAGHGATTAPTPASATPQEVQISKEKESKEPEVIIDELCIGFLIAMPRPPPGLGSKSSSSHLSEEWSPADSRWSEHLSEGQLPELNVGISTFHIPIRTDGREHRRRR